MAYKKAKRWLLVQVWIVCALGLFVDGYDLYISAVAEPFISKVFHPTFFMLGAIQASAILGAVFGALLIGRLADSVGRKSMLLLNLLFFVLVAILSSFAWSSISLCVFRFLIGFGVGADYPICAAYIAEMFPNKSKAKMMASLMFINCLASPLGVLMAYVIFHFHPNLNAWRIMFLSGAIPALIGIFMRAKLPESFVWRAHQRLKKEKPEQKKTIGYRALFSPHYLRVTLALGLSWFCLDISYYGIGLFTPNILRAFHIVSAPNLLEEADALIKGTFFVNLFVMLGAASAIFTINKVNYKHLQQWGFLLSAFGLLMMSVSVLVGQLSIVFILMGFVLFNFFSNAGPGITTYLLPTLYYPTHIRATGHGVASAVGKYGAFIGALTLPLLQAYLGIYFTVFLLACSLVMGYLLTFMLPGEEKGKVLQVKWQKNKKLMTISSLSKESV